jgi:predicted O-methyltransferase YrrM
LGKLPKRAIDRVTTGVSAGVISAWYDGKAFTSDWTSWNFPNWASLLGPYRRQEARVLEIGSWEGRSALFFLNYLPHCRLWCVDTFAGGEEHHADPKLALLVPGIEQRFDANIAEFGERVVKINLPSSVALPQLGISRSKFDIAYIDGSHRSADVYSDGVLTWPMIVPGGIVIFDDYRWHDMADSLGNPKLGIDAFLRAFKGQYRIIHDDYQIAIKKNSINK